MNDNSNQQFPGIDYDIGVESVLGDDELFKEILLMFHADHAKDAEKIQQALLGSNKEAYKRLVHTLKGVTCSIGAMNLFEKVKLFDTAINESKQDQYQQMLDAVKPELNKIITGIEKQLIHK